MKSFNLIFIFIAIVIMAEFVVPSPQIFKGLFKLPQRKEECLATGMRCSRDDQCCNKECQLLGTFLVCLPTARTSDVLTTAETNTKIVCDDVGKNCLTDSDCCSNWCHKLGTYRMCLANK